MIQEIISFRNLKFKGIRAQLHTEKQNIRLNNRKQERRRSAAVDNPVLTCTSSSQRASMKKCCLAVTDVIDIFVLEIGKRIGMRVFVVYAGLEPACFKSLFPYWKVHAGVGQLQKKVSMATQ